MQGKTGQSSSFSAASLKRVDFARCLKSGRSAREELVNMISIGNHMVAPRLGMVVPKRLLPRAVDRNRIKRLMREWFRASVPLLSGRDVVIRLKTPVLGKASERALLLQLQKLAHRHVP